MIHPATHSPINQASTYSTIHHNINHTWIQLSMQQVNRPLTIHPTIQPFVHYFSLPLIEPSFMDEFLLCCIDGQQSIHSTIFHCWHMLTLLTHTSWPTAGATFPFFFFETAFSTWTPESLGLWVFSASAAVCTVCSLDLPRNSTSAAGSPFCLHRQR